MEVTAGPVAADESAFAVEHRGHVAIVWLDRPRAHNAMAPAFFKQLPPMLAELESDENVRAVVFAARGKHFCIGLDLIAWRSALVGDAQNPDESAAKTRFLGLAELRRLQMAVEAVAAMTKPVIAAVHGACLGGAVDLVSACDIRVAADGAYFSVRETRIGVVADLGTLQRLPRLVPPGVANELIFTGRDFTAEEAASIGFVNRVHADVAEMHASAIAIAEAIASNPPMAVAGAKTILVAAQQEAVRRGLDQVALWNIAFHGSKDAAEAVEALISKRDPHYDFQ